MQDVTWIEACKADDLNKEDVFRFDHDDRTFAIYRNLTTSTLLPTATVRMSRPISRTVYGGRHYRMSDAQRTI